MCGWVACRQVSPVPSLFQMPGVYPVTMVRQTEERLWSPSGLLLEYERLMLIAMSLVYKEGQRMRMISSFFLFFFAFFSPPFVALSVKKLILNIELQKIIYKTNFSNNSSPPLVIFITTLWLSKFTVITEINNTYMPSKEHKCIHSCFITISLCYKNKNVNARESVYLKSKDHPWEHC